MLCDILVCPKCGQAISKTAGSLVCKNKHTYDIASSGYVNFNTKSASSGDSPDMVRARSRFLDGGYYSDFLNALKTTITSLSPHTVVDAGCGEGYYSAAIADTLDVTLLGFDLSKSAVNKAAKRTSKHKENTLFAVCSIFDLPIKDNSIDIVMSLFAPLAGEEFTRIIKPGGHIVMGVAGKDHLLGLKKAIYDDVYKNSPEKVIAHNGFFEVSRKNIKYTAKIKGKEDIKALFAMTPYYWKTSESDAAKLDYIEELETLLDFDIIVFERRA